MGMNKMYIDREESGGKKRNWWTKGVRERMGQIDRWIKGEWMVAVENGKRERKVKHALYKGKRVRRGLWE